MYTETRKRHGFNASNMLRLFLRNYRSCILVFMCLYMGMCVWLMTSLQLLDARPHFQRIFERVFDPFESVTNRRCSVHDDTGKNDGNTAMTRRHVETNTCGAHDVNEWAPEIDVEGLWDTISVGYPNMVLTVTGWVEMVQVKTWTQKPLHVIIVPHSHQDPGWIESVDSYYTLRTKQTLNLLVDKLLYYPNRKFVWTEVVFLERWWKEAPQETKAKFQRLLIKGQLELLTGGWVMTDESVAHYGAMLDQLTEGQQWIEQTFSRTVDSSWAIDPFGHSSTMAYILSQSGVHNNVIQRAHFAIKRYLAQNKWLEFYWKQYWDHHGHHRVLTHIMPFMSYGIPYSCGPDRSVCCKFDFYKKQCYYGNTKTEKVKVDEFNVAKLAYEFWEQLQKKSELFRNNVLLVPHGDDFRYDTDDEWDIQFGYLGKIMSYINRNKDMNMKIEFGTVSDYFNAIGPSKQQNRDYPTLSGDLIPYTDRGEQYWSGFYSSRPYYKYIVRKLQALLRSAEIFFTFSLAKLSVDTSMVKLYEQLQSARRAMALHQHHDAITGTSKKVVAKDFGLRLNTAIKNSQAVLQAATTRLLQTKINSKRDQVNTVNMTLVNTVTLTLVHADSYLHTEKLPKPVLLGVGWPSSAVVVTNSLGYSRHEVVHVLVNRSSVFVTDGQDVFRHQISPVWITNDHLNSGEFLLSFEVDIGPLSINTYYVKQTAKSRSDILHLAEIFNFTKSDVRQTVHNHPFKIVSGERSDLVYSNLYLTAYFSHCDGMLKSIHYNGEKAQKQKADVHFVVYTTGQRSHPFKDKSGAYTFIPDGPAKDFNKSHPVIIVVKGVLFTEVKVIYPDIVHTATIYNIVGSYGMGVHLSNLINMNSVTWNNSELVMRVETNVRNDQHSFCTDVNGFQLHKRKTRAKMTIQGNLYPVTTMAALESIDSRVTLFTTSSHGMASLVSGWLEVVLDRRLTQDDWRGLDEGVTDNMQTKSSFFIMFEKRKQHVALKEHICLPSLTADHHSESLNNPLIALFPATSSPSRSFWGPLKVQLADAFPCDLHLVNLRMLPLEENIKMKQALLVLHRKGLDCRFQQICNNKELWLSDLNAALEFKSLRGTTITGTRQGNELINLGKLDVKTMHMKTFKIGFS